jgi:endo-1,4-beta-xylanase
LIIDFADIKGHWAETDIKSMVERGVINGVSDTEFAPGRTIIRAGFLALIVRLIGAEQAEYNGAYTDVSTADWYAKVVQTGKDIGVIDDAMIPGGVFSPKEPVTREEMTSFIIRAYEYKTKTTAPSADIELFKDKGDIAPWALRYAERKNELFGRYTNPRRIPSGYVYRTLHSRSYMV